MSTFNYKAKDRSGNTVTGAVEAADEHAAAATIREMGHLPMDIRAVRAHPPAATTSEAGSPLARYLIYPLWTGVNIRHLALFYTQLATLLSSGMTLSEALRSVGSRTRGALGRIIREACDRIQSGGHLSETLSRYPRVFSPLQLALLRAGESGGLLQQMIERIASYLEHEMSIRRQVIKALFYPIIIFAFMILRPIAIAFILGGVAAGLATLLATIRGTLLPLLICVIILKLLFQFRGARLVWDFVKLQPPWVGTTARKIAMSRFSRALAVLYSAGQTMSEAVFISADACANLALAGRIRKAVPDIRAGVGLSESLEKTGAVTPMVLDMLVAGEKTGSMDLVLHKVADYMDGEVDVTVTKMGIVLFVSVILLAAVLVTLQLLAFYTGYFNTMLGPGG